MPQSLPSQISVRSLNPIQDPQVLPLSYAMPIVSARFGSPAGCGFMLQLLVDLFRKR